MSPYTIMVEDFVRAAMAARLERLEREARALLAVGYRLDELTIVVSSVHPDGRVMACEHLDAYEVELRAAGVR